MMAGKGDLNSHVYGEERQDSLCYKPKVSLVMMAVGVTHAAKNKSRAGKSSHDRIFRILLPIVAISL